MDIDYKGTTESTNTEPDNLVDELHTTNDQNIFDLNDEIMTDVYDSLCSWDEAEIDSNDQHSMNITQFNDFFDKYIYSTLSINDYKQLSILDSNKHIIIRKLFNYICHVNNLKLKIPFQHFVIFVEKLGKKEFVSIFSKSETNQTNNNNNNNTNHKKNKLEVINEYIPLIENKRISKKQLILRLQRLKKKFKDIRALERKLSNGEKLNLNQIQKIEKKNEFEKEKKCIQQQLTDLNQNELKKVEIDGTGQFIYKLYEQQCMKQRNKYKQQNQEMQNQWKEYLVKYKTLQQQNEELMLENEQLKRYKQENILLKKRLAQLQNSYCV